MYDNFLRGVVVIIWRLGLQLPVQSRSGRGVLNTSLSHCDQVCQGLATGRWFSQGNPVSSTNKTDRHDIAEIMLKVALNTITITRTLNIRCLFDRSLTIC
jgi:hypothetical protein